MPAEGVNDPYNLLTHGKAEGAKPTVVPVGWWSEHKEQDDPLTVSILETAVEEARHRNEPDEPEPDPLPAGYKSGSIGSPCGITRAGSAAREEPAERRAARHLILLG